MPRVPDVGAMREWQVRAFVLKWQRDAMAKRQGILPGAVLPDAALNTAAKKFVFPQGVDVPPEMQRLLDHFGCSAMHESGGNGIS